MNSNQSSTVRNSRSIRDLLYDSSPIEFITLIFCGSSVSLIDRNSLSAELLCAEGFISWRTLNSQFIYLCSPERKWLTSRAKEWMQRRPWSLSQWITSISWSLCVPPSISITHWLLALTLIETVQEPQLCIPISFPVPFRPVPALLIPHNNHMPIWATRKFRNLISNKLANCPYKIF